MFRDSKNAKRFLAAGTTAALVATALVPAAAADTAQTAAFTDVNNRYQTAVDYLVSNNLAKGMTATSYGVNANIKRGDAAIILAQALNLMDLSAPASGFTDVPDRGALAINSLKAAGVIKGKSATRFGFNDTITRGEVALIMSHAAAYHFTGSPSSLTFTDVNSRYSKAVAGLFANGITEGVSATKFGTDNSIKRGDFAVFVYRAEMLQVDEILEDFKDAMNGFAEIGAEMGYDVVIDETKKNTFNITGDGSIPTPENGSGFFQSLAAQGIETIAVNGTSYTISDDAGNVADGAAAAKEAIMANLAVKQTADITFHIPDGDSTVAVTYTFNFKPE